MGAGPATLHETERRAAPIPRRLRPPSLESLFVAAVVLFGFRLGAEAIGDNSTFQHLRTGVDIVAGRGIPRSDPYSFTAAGEPWVVQSWLAAVTYGVADRIGGLSLVVLQQAVLMAGLAWLIARLAKAGTPLRTGLAASVAVGIGSGYWTPRPLLFGLICMALLVTVVERRRSPWWLVPLAWVWVNTHGSFPLGLAWLALRAAGEWIDDRRFPRELALAAGIFVLGLGAGALNPLGPRLLTFPLTLGEKRSIFRSIVEWRSPNFQDPEGIFALVFIGVALLVLFRVSLAWRDALPAVAFLALGLVALRNVPVAAVVLAPALGRALRPRDAEDVDVSGRRERGPVPRLNWWFLVVIGLAMAIFAAGAVSGDHLAVNDYPLGAIRYLDREGLLEEPHRVAHQDVPGGYLILKYGRRARVFIDDRYDMYPLDVSNDYESLLRGRTDSRAILDRYRIDVVMWDRSLPLVPILRSTGEWRQVFREGGWVVLRRRMPAGG